MSNLERDLVILVCGISAGVHAALTPHHLGEGLGAGLGFLAATVVLAGLAVVLTRSEAPLALALGVLTLAGLLGGYALAITTGVPLLQPEPEPVDRLALATKAVEVVGLVAAIHLLPRGRLLTVTATERTLT